MPRLARTIGGTPLLGDRDGFLPLSAATPSVTTVNDSLSLAASGDLPTLDNAITKRTPEENLSFGIPFEPGKLWGIGLNYADHADDLNEDTPIEPASFMKPSTAVTSSHGPIQLPPPDITDYVTAEAELAVVIGKTCKDVPVNEVDDVVAGYLPIIDMTAEDILKRNPRFLTRSKSFDSFLVLGSSMITTDEVSRLKDVSVRTVVNDEVWSENVVRNMTMSPHELVAFHSRVMTLEPSDVISTGTPGAKHITPGDVVRAEVEKVGSITVDVVR